MSMATQSTAQRRARAVGASGSFWPSEPNDALRHLLHHRGAAIPHRSQNGYKATEFRYDTKFSMLATALPPDCACGEVHDLWTHDGRICERQVLDTGDTHLQPCSIAKIYSRRNADHS